MEREHSPERVPCSRASPWSPDFSPPAPPSSERLLLEILSPDVVELDYQAIMDSRARLREELQWGGERPWPADDFTLAENHQDLSDHQDEFVRREAYAYTVLDPSRETCLGCVYLTPWHQDAKLSFWVIDRELATNLETHLLETVLTWFDTAWPFDRVVLPFRASNPRGVW